MKKILFVPFVLVLLVTSSCTRHFTHAQFEERAASHQIIAVLPFEVVTTGRMTRQMSEAMLDEVELAESRVFQMSFHDQMLHRFSRDRRSQVSVQHYSETNRLLEQAGLDLRDAWRESPVELANILGVDAVVRNSVHKDTYLTDMESFGISLASTISVLFGGLWFDTDNRTSDVRINSAIVEANTGVTLWSATRTSPTRWDRKTSETVNFINRRVTKHIPYRRL